MSHAGSTRNFESTLRGLAERDHEIHLAFDRMHKKNLPGLWDLTNSLVGQYPGITSGGHPRMHKDEWSVVSGRLRASLDYMRYLDPEFRDAPKLRRRAQQFPPHRVERLLAKAPPPAWPGLRTAFQLAERSAPISPAVERYLRDQRPDTVLVTPLLEPGSIQVDYLRAAKQMGIPTCLCVSSWDNLTNKGLIHELPDAITVWNEMQVEEAQHLHKVPRERVVVTGAAAYDHWFGWEPSRRRDEFAARVGLDPARPFVLYVGSSAFIAPNEAAGMIEWMDGLREHGLGDMQVLARPHPANPLVGDKPSHAALAAIENIKLYPPHGANPTDAESRQDYFDSMYYCSAVAGVNTSAFLEAAILGRPVYTVFAPRHSEVQHGMLHFHHLLTAGGGLLHTAETYEEHASMLRDALAAPHPEGCVSERSRNFTAAFIRPYGVDEPATPRMVSTIEELPQQPNREYSGENGGAGTRLAGVALAHAARQMLKVEKRRRRRLKHERDRRTRQKATKASKGAAHPTRPTKVEKSPKAEKPPKAGKSAKPPKAEKLPKPPKGEKTPKPPKAAKPVETSDSLADLEALLEREVMPETQRVASHAKAADDDGGSKASTSRSGEGRPMDLGVLLEGPGASHDAETGPTSDEAPTPAGDEASQAGLAGGSPAEGAETPEAAPSQGGPISLRDLLEDATAPDERPEARREEKPPRAEKPRTVEKSPKPTKGDKAAKGPKAPKEGRAPKSHKPGKRLPLGRKAAPARVSGLVRVAVGDRIAQMGESARDAANRIGGPPRGKESLAIRRRVELAARQRAADALLVRGKAVTRAGKRIARSGRGSTKKRR
jgi:hypothetical protein